MALGNVFNDSRQLPHYTSRKEAGIGKEEPFYKNLFLVTIIPPAPIQAITGDLLTAQLTGISGVKAHAAGSAADVEQTYRGATRSYANGKLSTTVNDLTLNFNLNLNAANQLYIYKILRAWRNLVMDPTTGRRGLKVNYVGSAILDVYNREGDVFQRLTFGDMFISGDLPELGLDYGEGSIINMESIGFRSDYYTEELV